MKNVEIAGLKAQVTFLTEELEAYKPRKRKKVKRSTNNRFTTIQEITTAKEEARRSPKRRRRAKTLDQAPEGK